MEVWPLPETSPPFDGQKLGPRAPDSRPATQEDPLEKVSRCCRSPNVEAVLCPMGQRKTTLSLPPAIVLGTEKSHS